MKFTLIALVLMVVIAVTLAAPQQQQQGQRRRVPAQAGQQRRAGAQGGQRRRVRPSSAAGGAAAASGDEVEVIRGPDGKPLHLDPNLTLSKISRKDLETFMKNKTAVDQLVICFERIRSCRARAGVSLVRDVRSLSRGATCTDCDEAEQKHTRDLVGRAISLMQQNHPVEWRRVLPEIAFLL